MIWVGQVEWWLWLVRMIDGKLMLGRFVVVVMVEGFQVRIEVVGLVVYVIFRVR